MRIRRSLSSPSRGSLVALLACLPLWAACDTARELPPDADATQTCTACHGSVDNSAPPKAIGGKTATTERGVGAHQAHLKAGLTTAVECATCHVVPKTTYEGVHLDDKVDVMWTGIALANGATPTWDPATQTCSGTYCHGATLKGGGKVNSPKWTLVDGSQKACDACHGAPPPAPHPTKGACAGCHADTAGPGLSIANKASHINGKVDIKLAANAPCGSCHGAPPPSPHPAATACETCHGETAGPNMTIANAANHMNGKVEFAVGPGSCAGCHGAPPAAPHPTGNACETCHSETAGPGLTIIGSSLHRNKKTDVSVVNGADCAGCHGLPPIEKHPKQTTCHLCHGATVGSDQKLLPGVKHPTGKLDFAIDTTKCDTCHGAPPALPHPQQTNCTPCHAATVGTDGKLLPVGGHANGKVDMTLPTACNACHGSADSPAPPVDHNGKTDPALPTVGAHQAHLKGKTYSKGGMKCETCHTLFTAVDAPGHLDGSASTVNFPNGIATFKGTTASYAVATQTCSGVYCHGATMDGGKVKTPVWTQTSLACDGCHLSPPPPESGHPETDPAQGTKACVKCHSKTINADGTLNVQGGFHINGGVN